MDKRATLAIWRKVSGRSILEAFDNCLATISYQLTLDFTILSG